MGGGFDVDAAMERASELLGTWGLKVAGALAVLVLGLFVARMVRGVARRGLGRTRLDTTLIPFLSGLVYYLLLAIVFVASMGTVGIPTASLVAVVGAAGLAVGLALQGTLGHFASGVMLLWFRPFRVGHFIDIAGTSGTVAEVDLFATTLNTPDNVRITVPNGEIWGRAIKNFSANDTRRIDLVIGVGYDDDLAVAAETLMKVIKSDSRVLGDPEPVVAVSELGDSSVGFVVRPWVKRDDYWQTRWDLTREMKKALEAAGCTIPFPQRDVHVFNDNAQLGETAKAG